VVRVLLANKSDIPVADRAVSPTEGKELAKSLGDIPIVETSAKEGIGVEEAFEIMVRTATRPLLTASSEIVFLTFVDDRAGQQDPRATRERCSE